MTDSFNFISDSFLSAATQLENYITFQSITFTILVVLWEKQFRMPADANGTFIIFCTYNWNLFLHDYIFLFFFPLYFLSGCWEFISFFPTAASILLIYLCIFLFKRKKKCLITSFSVDETANDINSDLLFV